LREFTLKYLGVPFEFVKEIVFSFEFVSELGKEDSISVWWDDKWRKEELLDMEVPPSQKFCLICGSELEREGYVLEVPKPRRKVVAYSSLRPCKKFF